MTSNELMNSVIDLGEKNINLLPRPLKQKVEKAIKILIELFVNSRPPRIIFLGRRGAGKSSLVNAIFKQKISEVGSVKAVIPTTVWHSYHSEKGELRLLDTRGLGDQKATATNKINEPLANIELLTKDECPDVILFLCKAKDVNSRFTPDLKDTIRLREFIQKHHAYEIPVVAAITQVDELDPPYINKPPYENDEKKKNIQDAIDLLSNEFRASSIEAVTVIPISAYAEYDKNTGEVIYNENNKYWHIDELIEYIVENLPNNAQFKMARLGKVLKTQIKIAETIVGITAIMCGLFALTPIPFADAIPITSSQITMITAIVYVAGKETSEKLIRDFIVALGINIGAAVALREIAHTLPRLLFPGIGNMVSASVATTGTIALGQAAIEYFIKQKPIEEVRSSFKRDKPIITFRFDPIIKLIIGKIIKIKGDVVGGDKKIRRGKSQTSRVSKTRKT